MYLIIFSNLNELFNLHLYLIFQLKNRSIYCINLLKNKISNIKPINLNNFFDNSLRLNLNFFLSKGLMVHFLIY